ncbi:unnamed protein product [Prunus armeniaca]
MQGVHDAFRGVAQDWFHTLLSASIGSFKEFVLIFTKEYTSYRMVRKHADHLFNLHTKLDESLRDCIKRFKVEKANIIGCDDQIKSSASKRACRPSTSCIFNYRAKPNPGRSLRDGRALRTVRR